MTTKMWANAKIATRPRPPQFAYGSPEGYYRLMQRFAAAVLLVWVNFTLIFAAVRPAAADSSLPACCRRLGKHACSMASSSSGPAYQAALCPLYPRLSTVPVQGKASGVTPADSTVVAVVSRSAALPQTDARVRTLFSRTEQKRGPPLFLS